MLSIVLSVSLPAYSIANAVNAEALAAVLAVNWGGDRRV